MGANSESRTTSPPAIALAVVIAVVLGFTFTRKADAACTAVGWNWSSNCQTGYYWNAVSDLTTAIQNYLEHFDYPGYDTGGVDGWFGGNTKYAVEDFQADQGLPVDGIVGPQTWGVMDNYLEDNGVEGSWRYYAVTGYWDYLDLFIRHNVTLIWGTWSWYGSCGWVVMDSTRCTG